MNLEIIYNFEKFLENRGYLNISCKSPFRRLSVGGTNSNESLSILHVIDKIILKEATLQSTGR